MNHIWLHISYSSPYEAHLKGIKDCLCQKVENCSEIAKGHLKNHTNGSLSKLYERLAFSEYSIAIHSISVVGYVTALLAFVCVF